MSRKLIYVAQYFTPEPYLKDITFIKHLKEKGWDPIVITSIPNYPKGKVYDGFENKMFQVEYMENIKVIRVVAYAYHGLNPIKRILNYLIFSLFSSLAILKFGTSGSLYYLLQSSPFMVLNAWTVKLFKRKSTVLLDIQDIFPENIRISGLIKSKSVINAIDSFLNHFYYKSFDLFIVVSESFKNVLIKKNILPEEIKTVFNWSLLETSDQGATAKGESPYNVNDYNIVYAGNIGVHQGLSKLTPAFWKLKEVNPNIKLHLFGDGTDLESLRSSIESNESIVFHGRVPSTEIGKYLEHADALFLHLVKDPVYEWIIPSKLQAYIQIGKPILAGVEGEAKSIVINNELGEVFEPENSNDLILALRRLFDYGHDRSTQILQRSKLLYQNEFSRDAGMNKVNAFLSEHSF